MSIDEYEVIKFIKDDSLYRGISSPYIITTNLLTESNIPNERYLFGRTYMKNDGWGDDEEQLYKIFKDEAYTTSLEFDYDNLDIMIKNAGINYIVVDKNHQYYDKEKDEHSYLFILVAECGYGYSIYENDTYVLFFYER